MGLGFLPELPAEPSNLLQGHSCRLLLHDNTIVSSSSWPSEIIILYFARALPFLLEAGEDCA